MAAEHGEGEDDDDLTSALPGTVINGKYRIDALIGRGGMGSVWSAVHLGLNQPVAVKLISRRFAASRDARQRFDTEAKAVAQLRSRFVVQVYDNGETPEGTPYIVMELLEGESLDARIQKRGPIALDETLRFVSHAARALTRAHSLGIIHRDLKPENIFLTQTGDDDGEVAKVLDFGIAKIKTTADTSTTRSGTVVGTPLFMSPEQARALKTVDHRADVYSLGMVAFMMLTGKPAFAGESFADLLVAICTYPLPDICKVAPSLPSGLTAWFERACAREPEDRYASVDELLDALYAAVGAEPPNLRRTDVGNDDTSIINKAVLSPRASAGAGAGARGAPTMTALSISGAGLRSRSLLLPALLGGMFLVIFGFTVTIIVLWRRPPTSATRMTRSGAADVHSSGEGGSEVSVPAAPSSYGSGVAVPLPGTTSSAARHSGTPDTDSDGGVAAPGSASPRPAGKVAAPGEAKPTARPVDGRPRRPKTGPDLGF